MPSTRPRIQHTDHQITNALNSELGREKMWSRFYILPLLQAEEDRDQYRRYLADQERERQMFGKSTSPYNSDRFVRPTYAVVPSKASPVGDSRKPKQDA